MGAARIPVHRRRLRSRMAGRLATTLLIAALIFGVASAAASTAVVYQNGPMQTNTWALTDGFAAREYNRIEAPGVCLFPWERFMIQYTRPDGQILSRYASGYGACYTYGTTEYRVYARAWCSINVKPGYPISTLPNVKCTTSRP